MFLFVFTANPDIKYQVRLPDMQVIAPDEQSARELAHRAVPEFSSSWPDQSVATHIVDVYGWEPKPRAKWVKPFLHRHLTTCERRDIPSGIVNFGYREDD